MCILSWWVCGFLPGSLNFFYSREMQIDFDSKLPSGTVNMLTLMYWISVQTVSLPFTRCMLRWTQWDPLDCGFQKTKYYYMFFCQGDQYTSLVVFYIRMHYNTLQAVPFSEKHYRGISWRVISLPHWNSSAASGNFVFFGMHVLSINSTTNT